jgi:hypothetical protein
MVMTKTGIIATVFLAAFLVGSAFTASADEQDELVSQNVVATQLQIRTNSFLGEGSLWGGDPTFGYINVDLCYDAGGVNPLEDTWTIELVRQDDNMDWMELAISQDTGTLMPPIVAQHVPGEMVCGGGPAQTVEFELTLQATGAIEPSHTHTFNFDIVVQGEAIGSYQAPAGGSASMAITTEEAEDDPFEPTGDDNGDDNGGGSTTQTEESPAPAVFLLVLVGAALVTILRRRV